MTTTYRLLRQLDGDIISVMKNVDGQPSWCIPFDPDNTDYQEYLEWVAEGNEPLPADSE
jgi:hypothetical protein